MIVKPVPYRGCVVLKLHSEVTQRHAGRLWGLPAPGRRVDRHRVIWKVTREMMMMIIVGV